jgi:hypothetical protein
MPSRDQLITRRSKLLQQYTVSKLEEFQKAAHEKIDQLQQAGSSLSRYDFTAMHQSVDGIFDELTSAQSQLNQSIKKLSDDELLERCDNADPESLLNRRRKLYTDRNISSQRRGNAEAVFTLLAELMHVTLEEIPVEVKQPVAKQAVGRG